MRDIAAQLFAIVVSSAESKDRQTELIRELTGNTKRQVDLRCRRQRFISVTKARPPSLSGIVLVLFQAFEGQHGSALALGYLMGELFRQKRQAVVEDMETDAAQESKADATFIEAVKATGKCQVFFMTFVQTLPPTSEDTQVDFPRAFPMAQHAQVLCFCLSLNIAMCLMAAELLESSHAVMVCGACTALGEVGRCGALPLQNESEDKDATTKLSIIEKLISKVQSTKENGKVSVTFVLAEVPLTRSMWRLCILLISSRFEKKQL